MTVPDGSRRENRNGVLDRDPQGAESSLGSSHEFADLAGNGEVRRIGEQGEDLVHDSGESEHGAPSGVWLSAKDGTVLFHPVSAGREGRQRWSAPEASSAEEADEMTLDAACRLMPLLPRELIAEYLQLGPYRDDGDAS
ncbi:hypothetical protein ABT063_44615 [Streptomyces sp. NPDC002838]|uniref:hypothetical protein n=1 Tax=Streptomyces sp. NPDC002838 TaxID=3154436 RepID=UPI0033245031